MRHALAAYYAASRFVTDSGGEPWVDAEGNPWSDRATFRDTLADLLGQRVNVQAYEAGIRCSPGFVPCSLPPPLAWHDPSADTPIVGGAETREPPGCRGGAPAVKGHGCPALSSAVGPAPGSVPLADITLPADPLFCASEVQELPWNNEPINNRPHGQERAS